MPKATSTSKARPARRPKRDLPLSPAFSAAAARFLAAAKADRAMDTKNGLTAWEVIWLLFPESEYGSNQSALELWPGGVTWVNAKYYNEKLGFVWPGS